MTKNICKSGLAALLVVLESVSIAAQEPVTRVFQDGHRGYMGTRDAYIDSNDNDANVGAKDSVIVRKTPEPFLEQAGLVKFTGLDLPREAKIVSATLSLRCRELRGTPAVAAYGLVKDFTEGERNHTPAGPGETTWNALHHGGEGWGAPGAGKRSSEPGFDGEADQSDDPDDQTVVTATDAWYRWDVTRSFAHQLAHGKEYGWVLRIPDATEDTFSMFCGRVFPDEDAPRSLRPKLTVVVEADSARPQPRRLSRPKLILWGGHSVGTPADLLVDRVRLARFPFDGVAFPGASAGIEVFGPRKIPSGGREQYIAQAREILEPPSPLTANFLKVTAFPGTLDPTANPDWERRGEIQPRVWFGDFDIAAHNIRVAAEVARDAGMLGIAFDWEPYGGNPWDFEDQADARELGKSLEETRRMARQHGERFIHAINEVYPDMVLLIIPHAYGGPYGSELELIKPFLEGIFSAADPRMLIVDGNEDGYYAQTIDDFQTLYRRTHETVLPTPSLQEKYRNQIGAGIGVWLERNGWGDDPERNNISSARWQVKLEDALRVSDSIVWVFNGGSGRVPTWFKENPHSAPVPPAYRDATRRARELAAMQQAE
jgi:hypothetical protein